MHRAAVQRRAPAAVEQPKVGLVVQEELDAVEVRVARRNVQRRVFIVVLQVHNEAVRVALLRCAQQELRRRELAIGHRNLQRGFAKVGVRVELRAAIEAQVYQRGVVRPARKQQWRIRNRRRRVHEVDWTAVIQQLLHNVELTAAARCEELVTPEAQLLLRGGAVAATVRRLHARIIRRSRIAAGGAHPRAADR